MNYRFVITPDAQSDVDDAMSWYDSQDEGVGNRFISAIQKQFELLVQFPFTQRQMNRGARRAILTGWPYFIYHRVIDETVRVFSVIHTSRDPKYIATRTSLS